MNSKKIIEDLGGPTAVSRLCGERVTPQAVSQWKENGIPAGWGEYLRLLKPTEPDITDILKRWDHTARGIKKMPFRDAVIDMEKLVAEVHRLEREVDRWKKQAEYKKQEYETMHIEIGNVIRKYT